MNGFLIGLAALAFALNIPPPAEAQAQQNPGSSKIARPDQVVCESQEETGSRLTRRKVCRTRSQWAQIRQDERSTVERIQASGAAIDLRGN